MQWYVESDGAGPYVVESRVGRIATIELCGFMANGNADDWKRARLMAAAPAMMQILKDVNKLDLPEGITTKIEAILKRIGRVDTSKAIELIEDNGPEEE